MTKEVFKEFLKLKANEITGGLKLFGGLLLISVCAVVIMTIGATLIGYIAGGMLCFINEGLFIRIATKEIEPSVLGYFPLIFGVFTSLLLVFFSSVCCGVYFSVRCFIGWIQENIEGAVRIVEKKHRATAPSAIG